MGSSVSLIVVNIYMECFRDKALRTAQNLPKLWKKFLDETFVVQYTEDKEKFLQYINNIDSAIKFTVEHTRADGSVMYLDTLLTPEHNRTLSTSIYRKPTFFDQYLHWNLHHDIGA